MRKKKTVTDAPPEMKGPAPVKLDRAARRALKKQRQAEKKEKRRSKRLWKKSDDNFPGGVTTVMDLISPVSADLTHRHYVELDGVFHTYLYVAGYGYQTLVAGGWLASIVGAGDGVSVSFTLRRQPRDKILPKVTQSTMWSRSRMRDVGDTRSDYEELDSAIASGMYIKDGINRYNEDYYDMYTLIEVTADDLATLEQRVADVEMRCASQDMVCKRCDYRQEQAFQSFLPIVSLDADLERKARRNVLTTAAAAAFPFSSYEICEQDGILIGVNMHTGSLCMLDIFNSARYSNANVTAMGMSGAGKTYLLELIAMRYRQQGTQVFIVAPYKGYEYRPACEAVGGLYAKFAPSSPDCINFLEIRRSSLDIDADLSRTTVRAESLLADKISRLHIYYSLLKPNITEEEKSRLDVALMQLYERFGITKDNDSLFADDGSPKRQPTPRDLYEILMEKEETRSLATPLNRFVNGSAASLGGETNIDLTNKYVVLDISEIGKDLRAFGAMLAADICLDYCKKSRTERKVIILDEIWTLIGAGSNALAAEFVLELFKTVRGYGAAAIAATQDLEDFFALENGKYGKALLNNSRTKIALMTEPEEAKLIQQSLHLTDEELNFYNGFERGQALLCAGKNRIGVNVHASRHEHELITTDRRDLERIRHRMEIEKLKSQEMQKGAEDE